MKKILSYIFPQTEKIHSDINGELEITYINGKKILDSENANYSYGSLQKVLEFGLSKINLIDVESILILGLGGGSVIQSLKKKFHYEGKIKAIEIDKQIISIAENEFGIYETENFKIINQDAYKYVEKNNELFDLIIIDLFIDDQIPTKFYSTAFCQNLSKILNTEGKILFNLGMDNFEEKNITKVVSFFKDKIKYNSKIMHLVKGSNTVLIITQ